MTKKAFEKIAGGLNEALSIAREGHPPMTAPTPDNVTDEMIEAFNTASEWKAHFGLQDVVLPLLAEIAQLRSGDVDYQVRARAVGEAYARMDAAKADANRLAEGLRRLVFLKDGKDRFGKDVNYIRQMPLAWEAARAALAEHDKGGAP